VRDGPLYPAYRSPMVKVDARVEGGRVRLRWRGAGGWAARRLFGGWAGLVEGERPAKATDETLFFSCWLPPMPSDAWGRYLQVNLAARRGRAVPEMLTISVTERCPNRCRHCALPDREGAELPWDLAREAADDAVGMGCTHIIVDGGEPALYPHLERLVRHVDKSRAIVTMFTSGYGITRERARALREAGLYAMHISLDFPTAGEHDRFRGRKGVFAGARAAARHALDAGLMLDAYVVLAPHNVGRLDELFELSRGWEAHELSFYEIVPTGRWADGAALDAAQRGEYAAFVKRARRAAGPRVNSIPGHMEVTGCFAGRRWAHVTPRGDVLPCACIPRSWGNLADERLPGIWRRIRSDPAFNSPTCLAREAWFRERYL